MSGPWGGARWGNASPEEQQRIKRRQTATVVGASASAAAPAVLGMKYRSKAGLAALGGGVAVGGYGVNRNRQDVKSGKVIVGRKVKKNMSVSAFGVDHGEFSKAGPVGRGLYAIGRQAGKANKAAREAGAASQQHYLKHGTRSKYNEVVSDQAMKPRGRLAQRSRNFRNGFSSGSSQAHAEGALSAKPLPKFLR